MKKVMVVLVIVALAVIILGGCSKSTDPEQNGSNISITDGKGESSPFSGGVSPQLRITNFDPNISYRISLTCDAVGFDREYVLTTNSSGDIPPTTLDFELLNSELEISGTKTFSGEITELASGSSKGDFSFDIDLSKSRVFTCDNLGNPKNSYTTGETVYLRGMNFNPGSEPEVYVCYDRKEWLAGQPYIDVSGGVEEVTVDATGEFLVPIWTLSYSLTMPFDIIVDMDQDGVYSSDDLSDGWQVASFVVQNIPSRSHLNEQIACDALGYPKDIFLYTEQEEVYVCCNPQVQMDLPSPNVDIYVVAHRDTWTSGEVLDDQTSGVESMWAQEGCNSIAVTMVGSDLPAGLYDVIIDVNQNGQYDMGVDFIDNIDATMSTICGFEISDEPPMTHVSLTGTWYQYFNPGYINLVDDGVNVTGGGSGLSHYYGDVTHDYYLTWTSTNTLEGFFIWSQVAHGCSAEVRLSMTVISPDSINATVANASYDTSTCEITSDWWWEYDMIYSREDPSKGIPNRESNVFITSTLGATNEKQHK